MEKLAKAGVDHWISSRTQIHQQRINNCDVSVLRGTILSELPKKSELKLKVLSHNDKNSRRLDHMPYFWALCANFDASKAKNYTFLHKH